MRFQEHFRRVSISNFFKGYEKQLTIISCILILLIVIFRAPNILLEPRFWAEEGTLYYAHATLSGILEGIFFSPKGTAGYFNLAASFPATIAAHFSSVELAPFVTTYFSLFIYLMIFSLVLWGKSYFWNTLILKVSTCFIILFFPSSNASGETWLNTINLQVYCGLIAFIIVLENTTVIARTKKWFLRLVILFCVLSGAYTIFLAPLYFVKCFYERSRETFIHLFIIIFGSLIQISAFAYIKYNGLLSAKKLVAFSWEKALISVLEHQIALPFLGYTGKQFLNNITLFLADYVSLAIISMSMILVLVKCRSYINLQLVLGFFLLALLTSVFSMGGVAGGRYAVLPSIVFGLLLLSVVSSDILPISVKYIARFVLACSILSGAYDYQFNTKPVITGSELPRPDWTSQINNWRKDTSLVLNMWPYYRWKGRIPSIEQVSDLNHKFENEGNIYLQSGGKWHTKSLSLPSELPFNFQFKFDVKINKCNKNSVLHIQFVGESHKSMQWKEVDLTNMCGGEAFQVRVNSRGLYKKGHLKMSDVKEIVFHLKGQMGTYDLELSNIQLKSPRSAINWTSFGMPQLY